MAWARLSAMARQTKKAVACLLIVTAFLAMTASAVCADTLVLAAADTWPTAYLVDGRPTGIASRSRHRDLSPGRPFGGGQIDALGAVPQRSRDRRR